MRSVVAQIDEATFDRYLEDENKTKDEYKSIHTNISYLKLPYEDKDTLKKYKEIVIDKYKIEEHDNVVKLLKTDEFIDTKLIEANTGNYQCKTVFCTPHKIKLLRDLERSCGIGFLDVSGKCEKADGLSDDLWLRIKTSFQSTKKKPNTPADVMKLYVAMVKHITSNTMVTSKRLKTKKDRDTTAYKLNEGLLKTHLELNTYKNNRRTDFHDIVKERCGVEETPVESKVIDHFLDDE